MAHNEDSSDPPDPDNKYTKPGIANDSKSFYNVKGSRSGATVAAYCGNRDAGEMRKLLFSAPMIHTFREYRKDQVMMHDSKGVSKSWRWDQVLKYIFVLPHDHHYSNRQVDYPIDSTKVIAKSDIAVNEKNRAHQLALLLKKLFGDIEAFKALDNPKRQVAQLDAQDNFKEEMKVTHFPHIDASTIVFPALGPLNDSETEFEPYNRLWFLWCHTTYYCSPSKSNIR